MKFNRSELEQLFEEINEIINFIEISQYSNRRHRIFLGNGDKINFSIPNESIAHLLGINTNYLISTGRFNCTNSFELLKEMCENTYRIHNLYIEGNIKYEYLFSPFVLKKIEFFKENIKINIEETELVCKYDTSRCFITDQLSQKYDYIIIKKFNDDKIGILGLVNNGSYYVPMSNQLYDSFEDAKKNLSKYLKNQEVTIITGINYFNTVTYYDKSFYLPLNQKVNKIKNIKLYKDLFNCSLDLSGDYEYSIKRLKENRNNQFEDNDLIDMIVDSIKRGKLIDNKIFRHTNLSKIIEAFNDHLCSTTINSNNSISESYSKIKKDLEAFKSKLLETEELNGDLKEKVDCLTEANQILKAENTEYKETETKILELLSKKPRM